MVLKQLDGLWGRDLYIITEAKISSRLSKNLLGESIHTKIMEENRALESIRPMFINKTQNIQSMARRDGPHF